MTRSGDTSKPVAVLGAGSWGTALAISIAANGFRVRLWGRDAAAMQHMAAERCNQRYLPDVTLHDNIEVFNDFDAAVADVSRFLAVVPSHAFPDTLARLHAANPADKTLVWGTKGLAPGGGRLLSEVAHELLGDTTRLAVISGPSFAGEVARGLPSALTVAAADIASAEAVASWFRSDRMRIYSSDDLPGVQLGGAIKNVMAIATGISDGLGLGANSRAALITRGLAEMTRLGQALGGRMETFMGLTGVGDLILTCTDDQSRNRRVGLGLGRGESLEAIRDRIGQEAEGVDATRELYLRSRELGVEMPITTQVYRVLFEDRAPTDAVQALLTREPARE
jgi:glycerol-3-phosphate dehydrogenase (NAD(P)+)